MKKILTLTLLLVFAFCFPVLAAEEKTLGENQFMVFKYKVNDNARIGGQVVELNVYDKDTKKKLINDKYLYQGVTDQGIHIQVDSRRKTNAEEMFLKLDNEGYAELKITYMKDHDLILKLKAKDKKVFVFDVKE